MRNRRWIWVVLFILVVVVVTGLATSWNVALVSDYQRLRELSKGISQEARERLSAPWVSLLLGLIGFAIALGGTVVFFVRLLQEMRLNQLQNEFLASVSHDLKTPIATIELSSSLLRTGNLSPEETTQLWASHASELHRLKEQVETLLQAARLESGPLKPQRTMLEMETWLSTSISRWRQTLGPRGTLLREGQTLRCEAFLDPRMLNLIVDNILDNARKFARGNPRVTLESELLPTRWRIRFKDEGWGFEPADAEKIFNRFFRAKTEAPYAIPGTGLGLYLVATAAHALKISIQAESPGVGKGSIFTLEGPRVSS